MFPVVTPTAILILILAAAFPIVGFFRIVEFEGLEIRRPLKTPLVAAHLVGCLLFAAGLSLFALDPARTHGRLLFWLMGPAILLLFPVQIYLGIKRRIRLRDNGR